MDEKVLKFKTHEFTYWNDIEKMWLECRKLWVHIITKERVHNADGLIGRWNSKWKSEQ